MKAAVAVTMTRTSTDNGKQAFVEPGASTVFSEESIAGDFQESEALLDDRGPLPLDVTKGTGTTPSSHNQTGIG